VLLHEYQLLLLQCLPVYFAQVWPKDPASKKISASSSLKPSQVQEHVKRLTVQRLELTETRSYADLDDATKERFDIFQQDDINLYFRGMPEIPVASSSATGHDRSGDVEAQIEKWNRIRSIWLSRQDLKRWASIEADAVDAATHKTLRAFRVQLTNGPASKMPARCALLHGPPGTGKVCKLRLCGRRSRVSSVGCSFDDVLGNVYDCDRAPTACG